MAIKKTLSPQASDILRTNPHIRVRLENSGIIAGRILLAQLPTINARVLSGLRTIENFSLDKTIHAQALGNLFNDFVCRPQSFGNSFGQKPVHNLCTAPGDSGYDLLNRRIGGLGNGIHHRCDIFAFERFFAS